MSNKFYIHYRKSDGEIMAWESTLSPGDIMEDCGRVELAIHTTPDPKLHKIDSATLELVDKSEAERALARLPTEHEVKAAIFSELRHTDTEVVADRPVTDERRVAWQTYRQTLRDLSKLATPSEMVSAWPLRPDGQDAITKLRTSI